MSSPEPQQEPSRHTNRLAGETSPYLLQHAHNPVNWYPWGDEALRRAREDDRPILLSVGYSACHWCHVMERESFENEEIAALMNRWFVNVKVDREERPDIDHVYMTAVQMMTGQGGWPMTVFITPDGKPFYGGTYYPPDDRYGRPGFPRVLQAVAEAWEQRREGVLEQSETLAGYLRSSTEPSLPEAPVTPALLDGAFEKLRASYDHRLGGFGSAPKFPQPMNLDFLLRYAHRTGRSEPLEMATFTLERMAQGGIYDQLGGGFHRYSTDAYWLAPHFEKMLYDNAQLARTLLDAWRATGDTFFRRIAEETLDYVLREMTSPAGGFYSTQDADSEGEEGRFFVWSMQELEDALGADDAALFARVYDVTPRGNWEGKNILNVSAPEESFARSIGMEPQALSDRLTAIRRTLFETREQRVKPGRDEKVVTAWNGLMLAAFADAAAALDRADYRQAAVNNAEFVLRELYREDRLMRTGKEVAVTEEAAKGRGGSETRTWFKVAPIGGFLEDYACYADGLLQLYQATFEWRWLDAAIELTEAAISLFADPKGGAFYNAAGPPHGEPLVDRPREVTDNAVPSGNSVMVDVLLRLAALTGREEYRERAAGVLRRLTAMVESHPGAFGRLLCAADRFLGPSRELAVVGEPDAPATAALLRPARILFLPNLVAAAAHPTDPRAAHLPLLADRPAAEGRPTAYLCENYACRLPVTDPEELARQLREA